MNTFIDNTSLKIGFMLASEGYDYAAIPASQSVNGLQAVLENKLPYCIPVYLWVRETTNINASKVEKPGL